jgi:hypothetical protein
MSNVVVTSSKVRSEAARYKALRFMRQDYHSLIRFTISAISQTLFDVLASEISFSGCEKINGESKD